MPRQSFQPSNAVQAGINQGTESFSTSAENVLLPDSGQAAVDGSFNDMFDYASFMWDHELQGGNVEPTRWRDLGFADMDVVVQRDEEVSKDSWLQCGFVLIPT